MSIISIIASRTFVGIAKALILLGFFAAAELHAQSDADWSSMGGLPGADDQGFVHATAVDGSGNVYAGGRFRVIGNVVANGIAKWNGSNWSALGSGMNGSVEALAVIGNDLYAAGSFTSAGGIPANNIAKWNGTEWSAVGSGTDDSVSALAVIGNELYAGGGFTSAGGIAASYIAKWNGSVWSALGSGITLGNNGSPVRALAAIGNDLYVGGIFITAGGTPVNNIARWSGGAWSALETGMDNRVYALAVSGGVLYAGGDFTTAGAAIANRIAKWNGSAWSALGSGIGGQYDSVYALAASGSDIYAGGTFNSAGGIATSKIAKWDGSAWIALGSGMDSGGGGSSGGHHVETLAVSGNNLYAGGWFNMAGGFTARYIAKWNGSAWSALGDGIGGPLYAFAVSGSDLYAGGWFRTANGVVTNYIAKWNGSDWSALGSGMNGIVYALAASGGDVYVGGSFTTAGGITANKIAKWNGTTWSVLGSGMNGTVEALAVIGNDLYAGGEFTTAGGITANKIAKWNGSAWSALGTGMNHDVEALAVSGSNLYAGGRFTTAGGTTVNRVAKWNGSVWSALASGVNSNVSALAVSGGDLYVGGWFSTAGGVFANLVAKWNGSAWSALGDGISGGESFPLVLALAASGNDLYAGGRFATAGGVSANNIAKWNGSAWSTLGSGVNDQLHALALSGSDLYAGGYFTEAGAAVAGRIARANIGGNYEINIEQPMGTSIASGSSKDLSTVNVGSALDTSFIVNNLRAGVLNLTGLADKVVVSGPDAGDFNVSAQPASFVAGGGMTTFVVRFAPTSWGIKRATLSIANNDFDEGTYIINLVGNGVDPTLPETTITGSPASPTNSSRATISFTARDDTTAESSLVYEGRLDGAAYARVTSPVVISGLREGVHTYDVRAKDEFGNVDPIGASVTWVVERTDPFELCFVGTPFELRVGNLVTFDLSRLLTPGETMKLSGKLPSGLNFNAGNGLITGKISGKPGTYQASVQILQGNTVVNTIAFPITVLEFPSSLIGNFDCLLEDTNSIPSGAFKLNISKANQWMATLESTGATKSRKATGSFILAEGSPIAPITAVFPATTGAPEVTVNLSIDGSAISQTGTYDSGTLRGFRLASLAESPPATVAYSLVLDSGVQDGITVPAGLGWMKGTVSNKGIGTFTGLLGDGTAASFSLRLSVSGQAVVWSQPYKNKDSFIGGIVTLGNLGQAASSDPLLSDGVWWAKSAEAATLSYPDGFPAMPVTVGTSKWVAPATATALGASLGWRDDRTAEVILDGAGLNNEEPQTSSAALPTEFTIDDKFNLVTSAPATTPLVAWKGKVSNKDGAITGMLNLPSGFSASIPSGAAAASGVLVQDESWGDVTGCGLVKVPVSGSKGNFRTAAMVLGQ